MASGFVIKNVGDLDNKLRGYVSGTKASATGLKVGTQDLADRYNAITSLGNAVYERFGQATNFYSKNFGAGSANNKDLQNIFQAFGYS